MKTEIINKYGKNTTGNGKVAKPDIEFNEVILSDGSKAWSFYTYKGDICILDNQGRDILFDEYPIEDQKKLFKSIMNK